jgi:hypothetical protein
MDNQKIHYCFILSEEQMKYLRSKKYKIDRMECFMSLVELADRETKQVPISKSQQVEIFPGQIMIDNTELAKLWNKDRKTVPKILDSMESLGISSSQKVGDNRIHTLHSLSGWYVDGCFIKTRFATRRNADGTSIVTEEVPPAKVITIELPDDKSKDEESPDSDGDKSPDGNMGANSSADSNVSHTSPQSNDSGNEGKLGMDGKSSDAAQNNISHQSADIPSLHPEAEGNLNEGKRNEEPSAQQGGLSPQPDGIPSGDNGDYHQKPNGYDNPNGFHSNK